MSTPGWTQSELSAADGTRLHYQHYAEPGARVTLVMLHGHGEHSGRYEKFPRKLNLPLNYAVCDWRGQGRSGGRETYVERFEDFLTDTDLFLAQLKSRHGMREKILLGHSIGALIAVHWLLSRKDRIKGLILSSPCLGMRLPGFLIQLNNFIESLRPAFLYQNPVYPPHLTHNTAEVAAYRQDPHIKRKMSARLLRELLRAQTELEARSSYDFPFPVHVLMADDLEKVVDPAKTRLFFSKLTGGEKSLKAFPGFYHEIFNELEQDQAFTALRNCLQPLVSP